MYTYGADRTPIKPFSDYIQQKKSTLPLLVGGLINNPTGAW